jgi:hypothetical protein
MSEIIDQPSETPADRDRLEREIEIAAALSHLRMLALCAPTAR